MPRSLHVFLHGTRIGLLTARTGSAVEFRFDSQVDPAAVLSLSMPTVPGRRYGVDAASPFFNGLLPDGADARLRMAQQFDSLDTSAFGLLDKAGLDCAGAVQVYRERELPERSPGLLEPLTDEAIGRRLRAMLSGQPSVERDQDEHWSVSGAQVKTALRDKGGQWFRASGPEPHSHILKPGAVGVPGTTPEEHALVEHVTMEAARRIGVRAAVTRFAEFDGVGAIVVERFDRELDPHGALQRIHQEDMCQALGVDPAQKYQSDGGPGVGQIAGVLRASTTDPEHARQQTLQFADMVVANYLACAPDAHAKNFALVHGGSDGISLAPMYDCASGANSMLDDGRPAYTQAAMLVGATRTFGAATLSDWTSLERDLGLRDYVVDRVQELATVVPDAMSDALAQSGARPELVKALRHTPLLSRISASCQAAQRATA